jgi:hypothetical protein
MVGNPAQDGVAPLARMWETISLSGGWGYPDDIDAFSALHSDEN